MLPEAAVAQPAVGDDLFAGLPKNAADVYAAQARTAADAMQPQPIRPAVIRGFLPTRSLSIVYSLAGLGKSNMLLDAGVNVAAGTPCWPGLPDKFNHAGLTVSQCPVLWLDQDNGSEVMAERLAAFVRGHDAPESIPFHYLTFPVPPVTAARGLKLLTTFAQGLGAGLIVLDNLLRVAGVRDENSSEIDVAMGNLRQLAEDTGAAVVVIHHRRKDTLGREGDSLRGHSSIEAALDAAYLVTRDDDGGRFTLTVRCTKARRKPAETFSLIWTYKHADDGETLHSARFWQVAMRDKRQEATDSMRLQVLAALELGPKNTGELVEAVGRKKAAVTAMLKELNQQRVIVLETGPRGAKNYRLP